jgi:uncharacterized membrane protein YgaE (UPF0421/DUF939 family)
MLIFFRRLFAAFTRPTVEHSLRTAIAGTISIWAAHFLQLHETYWAAITTLIVMQSTLGPALKVSAQRFIGTALGAAVGAFMGLRLSGNHYTFGLGVLGLGLICTLLRLDRAAYRFGSVTLAIVMLAAVHPVSPWTIALHRFVEVSMGIGVGLLVTAVWPQDAEVVDQNALAAD